MDVKPGYQTSEFWLTIMTNILNIVNLFHPVTVAQPVLVQVAGIIATVAVTVSYFITRNNVKVAAASAPDTTTVAK